MNEQRHARSVGTRYFIQGAIVVIGLAICAAIFLIATMQTPKPFSSTEVGFTDASAHGMQIVPASCPSYPYDADAPYGCSGSTPICPDGVSPAPNADINQCTCGEGNTLACYNSCTITISPNPSAYSYAGAPVYIGWSSGYYTSQVYINNIGWVGTSGYTYVPSTANTDYSCYAYSPYFGNSAWYGAVLYVNPPPYPSVGISANPSSIQVGQSSTITATFSAGSGDYDNDTALNEVPPGGSEFTIPGYGYSPVSSYSYPFTPSSAGTYTFKPYVITSYYTSWNTFGQSVNVNVTNPPPSCTISASPASIGRGSNSTISWSSSNATSCTGNNFTMGPTAGSTSVSPSQTTTYSGSCTGVGGTTSCNTSGSQVTVTCPQSWSCSGSTIVQTNTNCSTTNIATCSAPAFCQNGSQICLYPAITVNASGSYTGNLQVIPDLVQPQEKTQILWNVSNAQSCTVTGTNGDSWTGLSGSYQTSKITKQTVYTLSCPAYGSNPNLVETQTVGITPTYREQ